MQDAKKVAKLVALGIITLLLIISYAEKCKAEGYDIPDLPDETWEEYLEDHPIMTIPPREVEDTPAPIRGPEPDRSTVALTSARWRAWHSDPEIENGELVWYYQSLANNNLLNSPLWYSMSSETVNGVYHWSTSGLPQTQANTNMNSRNTRFFPYQNNTVCDFVVYFTSATSLGYGLDFGYSFVVDWAWDVMLQTVGDPVSLIGSDIDIAEACKGRYTIFRMWDDEVLDQQFGYATFRTDEELAFTSGATSGFTTEVMSNRPGRKVRWACVRVEYGLANYGTELFQMNQQVRDDAFFYYSSKGPCRISGYMDSNPWWYQDYLQDAHIQEIAPTVVNGISSLFVPVPSQVLAWINQKASNQMENGSPVNRYYEIWLSLLSTLYNYNSNRGSPEIKIPPLSVTVQGSDYTYFNGIDISIDDYDIPVGDQSLFYYSRLVGTVCLVGGFLANYLYKLFKRIYDVKFSSGVRSGD